MSGIFNDYRDFGRTHPSQRFRSGSESLLIDVFEIGILKFELGWWSGGFNLWDLRRESNAIEIAFDRCRVGNGRDDSHSTSAVDAHFHVLGVFSLGVVMSNL